MEYYYSLLEQITTGTDSSLILFFVIVAAMMVPLYYLALKGRSSSLDHEKEKQRGYIEREREIVNLIKEMSDSNIGVVREFSAVVAENTAAIASLKAYLNDHGTESKLATSRIHDKIEQVAARQHKRMDEILSDISAIKAALKIPLDENHAHNKQP